MPTDVLSDPGPKAQTVIEFRNRVEKEHTLLYVEFEGKHDFLLRVEHFLLEAIMGEISASNGATGLLEIKPDTKSSPKDHGSVTEGDPGLLQISSIIGAFYNVFKTGDVSADLKADRLFLFASVINEDDLLLPVHIANRLYNDFATMILTKPEKELIRNTVLSDIGQSNGSMRSNRVRPGWRLLLEAGAIRATITSDETANALHSDNRKFLIGILEILRRTRLRPPALWKLSDSTQAPSSAVQLTNNESSPISLWVSLIENYDSRDLALEYLYTVGNSNDAEALGNISEDHLESRPRNLLVATCQAISGDFEALAQLASDSRSEPSSWIKDALISNITNLKSESLNQLISGRHRSEIVRKHALRQCVEQNTVSVDSLIIALQSKRHEVQNTAARFILDKQHEAKFEDDLTSTLNEAGKKEKTGILQIVALAINSTEKELRAAMKSGLGAVDAWAALCLKKPSRVVNQARRVLTSNAEFAIAATEGILDSSEHQDLLDFLVARAKQAAIEVISGLPKSSIHSDDLRALREELANNDITTASASATALAKFGDTSDAIRLITASRSSVLFYNRTSTLEAALELGGESIARHLIDTPDSSEEEISLATQWLANKGLLSIDTIQRLLYSDKAEVRLVAAESLYRTQARTQVEEALNNYCSKESTYYYNVVAILDDLLYGP
ncbi:hypothetical protein ACFQ68_21215 [Amycolatopsis japonica]|uniref:hypothetical protein n=1 Tax=Amycolatopsis japonica TaxID=208439 RepID=UPI00366BCB17